MDGEEFFFVDILTNNNLIEKIEPDITDNAGNQLKSDMGYRCVLTVSDGQVVYKD